MSDRLYVLVSGPPGSGKSTLAPVIASHLGLPLVAKDTIKDALMSVSAPAGVEESRATGRAAVAVMFAVAADAPGGSRARERAALDDVRVLPGRLVEVFCRCDPAVALARYRAREGTRHEGHFDRDRTEEELRHPEIVEPVAGGWPVLVVSTSEPVDPETLAQDVDALVGDAARAAPANG
jgi:predicted kinase